jgi:hypothetical protein
MDTWPATAPAAIGGPEKLRVRGTPPMAHTCSMVSCQPRSEAGSAPDGDVSLECRRENGVQGSIGTWSNPSVGLGERDKGDRQMPIMYGSNTTLHRPSVG